jgi:hypothetical protein
MFSRYSSLFCTPFYISLLAQIFPLPIFLTPRKYYVEEPMSLKEKKMVQLSAAIREKSDWEKKFVDRSILNRWRAEVATKVDDYMFRYVNDELRYYCTLRSGSIKVHSFFIFTLFWYITIFFKFIFYYFFMF